MSTFADSVPHLIHVAEDNKLLVDLVTVPLFTGAIGWITNWSGVLMLFRPIRFYGFRLPGLKLLWPFLPRKVQVVPAITKDGRIGWQGIVPSRVEKMASIATDKALLKVGSIGDFYRELEPDAIAEHLTRTARPELRGIVEEIMQREHPQLWKDLPPQIKEAVFARIDAQLPQIVKEITEELGNHVDQLIDAKLMIIRYFREHPEKMNDVFLQIGKKELRFMMNSGFYFGIPMGLILVFVLQAFPHWWVLPIGGVVIGYVVNYIAVTAVFEPVEPRQVGPFTMQGLFIKRQPEASLVFAEIIANDVINLENVGRELLEGPRADRTHQMLHDVLSPAADRAIGPAKSALRVAMGTREYDRIKDSLATEVTSFGAAFSDEEFNAQQAAKVSKFVGTQMQQLSPHDFAELLRSAIHSDEWLLFLHGAVLGFGAGLVHLFIFGV